MQNSEEEMHAFWENEANKQKNEEQLS